MDEPFDFDLLVIGAGSGGVRAARMAAQKGLKVAVVEDRELGGTCVNVGCVPKKLFVYASQFNELFEASAGFGWTSSEPPQFCWSTLRDNKNKEIKRLNKIYADLLEQSGATLLEGRAVVADSHRVVIRGTTYSSRYILVAVGGWPYFPEFPGSEHAVSSNEMFFLDALPKTAVVVGGGYIAVEFAGILNGLGVNTHLVYRGAHLLKSFDRDMSEKVHEGMCKKGIQVSLETEIGSIERLGKQFVASLSTGEKLSADVVLYATGRRANTKDLGLNNTSVKLRSNGSIEVDEHFQTADPSIYALGDVIDRVQLTPVAIQEAMVLVDHLFGEGKQEVDYEGIPTAVFSQPELACVGLSEDQARERFAHVNIFISDFKPMLHSLGGGSERITMKLVVDSATDHVVGCHMVGEHAAEIIQGMAIAIKAGVTKQQMDATIGIHPSAAEEFVTMRTQAR